MTTHELVYFDFDGGRAEAVRIAFSASGLKFKDTRLSMAEFKAAKAEGLYPTGVPILKVGDVEYTQSVAMLRYAGVMARSTDGAAGKLYPSDPIEALSIDQALDTMQDLSSQCPQDPDPEQKKKKREEFMEGKAKAFFSQIVAIAKRKEGPFIGGQDITIADLTLALALVQGIAFGQWDYVSKTYVDDNFPELTAICKSVIEHPIVTAYYSSKK